MKTRIFHTKFWTDSYIRKLKNVDEKHLFFYLITNEFVNIIHLFEMPFDLASHQTGIEEDRLKEILEKFRADEKIDLCNEHIYLLNAYKYQYYKGQKNNHLKLRLIFELNDTLLEYFKKPVNEIISTIQKENHESKSPLDEKLTNLLGRVLDRLVDRGIYKSIDRAIYTPSDTGDKPETINHKPETKNQKGQREGSGMQSLRVVVDKIRSESEEAKNGENSKKL